MNLQTTYPSFGYELQNGATTLWEQFGGGGTHNHIMFGTQSAWYFSDLAGIQMAPFNSTDALTAHASGWRAIKLTPSVTCEFLGAAINLTLVNATMLSSRGVVRSMWRLSSCPIVPTPPPPSTQPKTCALVLEKDKYQANTTGTVELTCGATGTINEVVFADFGTPSGSCIAGFHVNSSCTSDPKDSAKAIVQKMCLGKQSCVLQANVQTFGHQCLGVPKRLAVQVTCGAPPPSPPLPSVGPRRFDWTIEIPGGSSATVHMPLLAAEPDQLVVAVATGTATSGGEWQTVWRGGGGFVPGAAGVTSAAVLGDKIVFEVLSGEYSFRLRDLSIRDRR